MQDILQTIPHRPPFLFVDEIVEFSDKEATAKKTWESTESFYEGHYPGNPITPGVLLCEAVFQTGAIFLGKRLENEGSSLSESTPVLSRIQDARFKAMVKPGETIFLNVRLKEQISQFYFLNGKVKNEKGKTVLTLSFALAMVDEANG